MSQAFRARMRELGASNAYDNISLVDLVIETGINPYDIVALIPIIEGAGGVITTWTGGAACHGGRIVAAGDPRLHESAMKLLNS